MAHNFLVDHFDFEHLMFCPASLTMNEISLRTAYGELSRNTYMWCFADAEFRKKLSEDLFELDKLVTQEGNVDLLGYMSDDQVLLFKKTTDCHLDTATDGYRIFQIKFDELPVAKLMEAEAGVEVPVIFAKK